MPEAEIIATPRRESALDPIGLLEDYWADFLFFRKEALNSSRLADGFRTGRFLRCGLFAFYGLPERPYVIDGKRTSEKSRIEVRASVSLSERLAGLARSHRGYSPLPRTTSTSWNGFCLESRTFNLPTKKISSVGSTSTSSTRPSSGVTGLAR